MADRISSSEKGAVRVDSCSGVSGQRSGGKGVESGGVE